MSFDVAGISRFFMRWHQVEPIAMVITPCCRGTLLDWSRLPNGCDHGAPSTVRTVDRLV